MQRFKKHIKDIYEGGAVVFFRKGQKVLAKYCLRLLAPLAVWLNWNWFQSRVFIGRKFVKKYKNLTSQYPSDLSELIGVRDKAIAYFRDITESHPVLADLEDWITANTILYYFLWNKRKVPECIGLCQKIDDIRRSLINKYQLDELNIMFVPRAFAYGAIGVYESLCAYIKAEILCGRASKKMILLLEPGTRVNNPCYLNYWRRYITVISDPLLIEMLSPLEKCLTIPLNVFLPFQEKTLVTQFSLGLIREQWNLEKNEPLLTLSGEDIKRGRKCLESLGVPRDAWFVSLHVREGGWNDNNSPVEAFRNADVETYLPAIKSITDAGGWVIRIGDASMKPLPDMPQVIDYARSNVKSDWMDVFLCAQCRFFIGTSSGMYTLAMAFGVPVVMTNFLQAQMLYCLSSRDVVIPKLFRQRNENRYVSFKELVSPPVSVVSSQISCDELEFETIDNSPEEIKDLVEEMLEKSNGMSAYSEEEEKLQSCFKILTAQSGVAYGDERIVVHARIGGSFLRKHRNLLEDEVILTGKRKQ